MSHQVHHLDDDEINSFLDALDQNKDGFIAYSEVEHALDLVHDEMAPHAHPHNLHHDTKDDKVRYAFLRSIIGSDAQRIPRAEFAARVREWQIPSLKQESEEAQSQREYMRSLSVWRRVRSYWAVHGPEMLFVGLVVGMQLAFGVWQMVKYISELQYREAFGWGVVLAKTCAGALYPTMFFLVLSMSRYLSTLLRRSRHISRFVNWDLSQEFHIHISIVAIVLATLHAIGHLAGSFVWGSWQINEAAVAGIVGQDMVPRPYRDDLGSLPGYTGLSALGLFYILSLLIVPQVRRWNYEVFQLGHLLIIPATLKVLDSETVEIKATIPSQRLWNYQPGQYVFLQVPKLNLFQWHPFTVSACVDKDMWLHIKTDGNWTKRLRELGGDTGTSKIDIGINGPFGAPAQRFYDFSHTIVVGSGIGVTPFSGILADLQARGNRAHGGPVNLGFDAASGSSSTREKTSTSHQDVQTHHGHTDTPTQFPYAQDYRHVEFHWLVRDRNHLLWFSDLLNAVSLQIWHRNDRQPHLCVNIHTHVTQKRQDIATHVYRWLLEKHRTPDHPESPLTGLINPTHFGRPDFVRILDAHCDEMMAFRARRPAAGAKASHGEGADEFKVGVFFCGAPIVGQILSDRCRLLTARGRGDGTKIEYHFMVEVFG